MTAQTTVRPSVWIGCLACYNAGVLNGRWFPAEGAAEVTPDGLHGSSTIHDELWCFDLEGFPVGTGEMSFTTAVQWPALLAWVETGCYVAGADNLPSMSDFEERYCGCWESFADYAAQLAEDIGLIDGWPEEVQRYCNSDAWTRDLKFDYTVADTPDGGVFIYRSF